MLPVEIFWNDLKSDWLVKELRPWGKPEISDLQESRFSRYVFEISLLDLDLEPFSFHFHFSISIFSHFHFTFISRSRSQVIFFHLHFSKRVNDIFSSLFTSRLSKTHSRRALASPVGVSKEGSWWSFSIKVFKSKPAVAASSSWPPEIRMWSQWKRKHLMNTWRKKETSITNISLSVCNLSWAK